MSADSSAPGQPWWKFGHVWLVIGGPLVVVIASFVTLYFAMSAPDPVLDTRVPAPSAAASGVDRNSLAPAGQARNHVATGVPDPKAKP